MIEYEVIKPFAHQGRTLVVGEFVRLPAGYRFKRLLFRGRICAAPPKHMREQQRRQRRKEL